MIYSIGYQNDTIKEIVGIMDEKGITHLIDVRSVPYSRKPGFNKNFLMKELGYRYIWMGDILGGKSGPAKPAGINKLKELEAAGDVMLLMCMENHPCDCHRLTDIARRLAKAGIRITHIFDGQEKTTEELTEEVCDERKKGR